jgi:hypothetical protein
MKSTATKSVLSFVFSPHLNTATITTTNKGIRGKLGAPYTTPSSLVTKERNDEREFDWPLLHSGVKHRRRAVVMAQLGTWKGIHDKSTTNLKHDSDKLTIMAYPL